MVSIGTKHIFLNWEAGPSDQMDMVSTPFGWSSRKQLM